MPRPRCRRPQSQRHRSLCSCANAHAQRVARIQHQLGLSVHKCRPFYAGIHFAIPHFHVAFKYTADNAFLFPYLPLADFAIRVKASQLGAGPRTTRRTIVGFAWTQHKVSTVHSRNLRWTEQLDVIDLLAVRTGDAMVTKRLPDGPSEIREFVDFLERQLHRGLPYQEEPVSTPGNISAHLAVSGYIDRNICGAAITCHIVNRNLAAGVQNAPTLPTGVSILCSPGPIRCR